MQLHMFAELACGCIAGAKGHQLSNGKHTAVAEDPNRDVQNTHKHGLHCTCTHVIGENAVSASSGDYICLHCTEAASMKLTCWALSAGVTYFWLWGGGWRGARGRARCGRWCRWGWRWVGSSLDGVGCLHGHAALPWRVLAVAPGQADVALVPPASTPADTHSSEPYQTMIITIIQHHYDRKCNSRCEVSYNMLWFR